MSASYYCDDCAQMERILGDPNRLTLTSPDNAEWVNEWCATCGQPLRHFTMSAWEEAEAQQPPGGGETE